ncbi:MAG: Gldg family protein [Chloroflexota bacterium]|nr:Gldg family protein [Chloroflexota bacterium]
MKEIFAVTRKELEEYVGSPMALIFIGAFLAVTLFTFFWVDTFFARGIADVRPLFRWMPVLMIFLVAALTMRQWSEEERSGTLETLLTLPVSFAQLVLGKFLAVLVLVVVALALTIFLPITVALLGNLDWGPVFGGYLASILLAAAYAGIGLFMSSRTDNQIVALISIVLVCGAFYLVGSGGVTDFVGQNVGEILRAIGAGSRFESIERGVVDLRDLLYYLTLTGLFLTLNVLSLRAKGWSEGERTWPKRAGITLTTSLIALNLVFVNVWVYPLHGLRLDLTEEGAYSLSPVTKNILSDLEEPLLIRGYFSAKTHPLLAPLVPTVRDMLREYEIASGGQMELEIIDPAENPEKEAEANDVYGIRPTPLQVADRYETSIVNAYFDVLIQYGDQSQVLNFQDLIEVEPRRDGTVDVRLRNLEYDLTSAIKKAVYGFQSSEAVLASLEAPAELTLYVTPDTLPEWLVDAPDTVDEVANEIAHQSDGKFTYKRVDPAEPGGEVTRDELYEQYGLQPIRASLFSDQTYYFYLLLQVGDETQLVNLGEQVSEASVRTALESALKRFSAGFLQVVGLWTPPQTPTQNMFGQMQQPLSSWKMVREVLGQEYEVRSVDLSEGQVPADVDVLVLVGPRQMTDKDRFAIDQYLMRGGSVIAAVSHYELVPDQISGGLALQPIEGGIGDLLAEYGITVESSLIMDPQNEPFPVVVNRQVGRTQVRQIQAIDYPFFVDIRPDGMATESPLVSNLSAVTLNWVSPVTVDEAQNAEREVIVFLRSSSGAWTQEGSGQGGAPNIQPNFEMYPQYGFPQGEETESYPLAVAVQGVFESAFKGEPSPFETEPSEEEGAETSEPEVIPPTIEFSPQTSRLVVIGSAEFLDDLVFDLSYRLSGERYRNSLKLLQNAVAWSTEDLDLLSIRASGTSARVLYSLSEGSQSFWEAANYVAALLSLVVLSLVINNRRRNQKAMELIPLQGKSISSEEVHA